MPATGGHTLYLVGGAPRVGKSSLAQRLLEADGIPWLPTDVLRTVLRRVLPELDAIDQDPVDAGLLAEVMYPHVEQAAAVCAEEAERFLIEGFELSPSYPARLRAALGGGPRSGRASWGTTGSPSGTSSPTGGPSPSTTVRHARSSARLRPGSGGGAGNCARSAPTPACRTSTWARSASRRPWSEHDATCSRAADGPHPVTLPGRPSRARSSRPAPRVAHQHLPAPGSADRARASMSVPRVVAAAVPAAGGVPDARLQRVPARQAPQHPVQVPATLPVGPVVEQQGTQPVDQVVEVAAQQEEGNQVRSRSKPRSPAARS